MLSNAVLQTLQRFLFFSANGPQRKCSVLLTLGALPRLTSRQSGMLFSCLVVAWSAASTAQTGPLNVSLGSDVTASFQTSASGFVLNRRTNTFDTSITVQNSSNASISLPLAVLFPGLPAGVQLVSASGQTSGRIPYFAVGSAGATIAPGNNISFIIKFSNTSGQRIPLAIRLLSIGTPTPALLLGGADGNINGVRDDVEPVIQLRFSQNLPGQAAAFQVLRNIRKGLLEQSSVEQAFASVTAYFRSIECLQSVLGPDYEDETMFLRDLVIDSQERVRAWFLLQNQVAGQAISETQGAVCD